MTGAPRATAAQLAARKLKDKPKGRKGAPPSNIIKQNPKMTEDEMFRLGEEAPKWAPMEPQSQPPPAPSTGLFGGSIQGSSGFSFEQQGGPSFPLTITEAHRATSPTGEPMIQWTTREADLQRDGGGATSGLRDSDRPQNDRKAKRAFGVSAAPISGGAATPASIFSFPASQASTNNGTTNNQPFQPIPGSSFSFMGPSHNNTFGNSSSNAQASAPITSASQPFQPPFGTNFTNTTASHNISGDYSMAEPNSHFGRQDSTSSNTSNLFANLAQSAPLNNQNTDFSNGQNSTPTTSTGLFANHGQPTATSNNQSNFFSAQNSTPTTSAGLFANLGQPASDTKGQNTLFGGQNPSANTASSLFGNLGQSAPSHNQSNVFGGQNSTSTTSTGLFAHLGQSTATPNNQSNSFSTQTSTPTTSTSLFANSGQPASSTNSQNNLFSGQNATFNTTGNMFGSVKQPTALDSHTSLFGKPNASVASTPAPIMSQEEQEPKPSSVLFGHQKTPQQQVSNGAQQNSISSGNIFANLGSSSPSTNENVGAQSTQSSSNLFAHLNKPSPASHAAATANAEEQKSQPSSNVFGNLGSFKPLSNTNSEEPKTQPSDNLFGHLNKSTSQINHTSSTSKLFGNGADKPNLFGNLNKPLDTPVALPNINGVGSVTSSSPDKSLGIGTISKEGLPKKKLFGGDVNQRNTTQPILNGGHAEEGTTDASPILPGPTSEQTNGPNEPQSSSATPSVAQHASTQDQETEWARLRAFSNNHLNPKDDQWGGDKPTLMEPNSDTPHSPEVLSHMNQINEEDNAFYNAMAPTIPNPAPTMTKVAGVNKTKNTRGDSKDYPILFPGLDFAKTYPVEMIRPFCPANFGPKSRVEFYACYRMKILNNEMKKYFETVSVTTNILPAVDFYNTQRKHILQRGSAELKEELIRSSGNSKTSENKENDNKRKAEDDEFQKDQHSSKRNKQAMPEDESQSHQNLTAFPANNIFTKSANPGTSGSSTALFGTSQLSSPQVTTSLSPAKGKRKGEELTKDISESGSNSPLKRAKMQNSNENGGGSDTSNIFKSILDKSTKPSSTKHSSPERKADANEDTSRVNPFASLPVPTSPSATNFTTLAAGNDDGVGALNANASTPKTREGLFGTPGVTSSTPTASEPPTHLWDTFMRQPSEIEEKRMKDAKEEEWNGSEDEEEWELNYKIRRGAELKEMQDKPYSNGQGQSQGDEAKDADNAQAPTRFKPRDITRSQSPGNSLFSSGTSTPRPASSTGSVLDNHASGKPLNFGGNIFGHLTDSDSQKASDADDESDDEGAESDSENKDPNYQPGDEINSGPGTPASETGAGIASAKKATNPFTFGASKFGGSPSPLGGTPITASSPTPSTSAPVRSLFDRIKTDGNGNPIKAASPEEKENTQPNNPNTLNAAKNPFASLSKPSAANDQTWKIDSPIKFGGVTPKSNANSVTPTFNITAASPIKPASNSLGNIFGSSNGPKPSVGSSEAAPTTNIFGNLFGSTDASKSSLGSSESGSAPTSVLFGSASNTKPTSNAVGFNFGGLSTTSSLFPSAAVSTTTSRATTPGATTDGDSATENDPDVERHEQINLTAGGPGEENEDVLHEVRAKALKWVAEDGQGHWATKGLGPLRVLKHQDNNAVRILLRADPSGTVVLNKGLLSQVTYKADAKTVKLLAAGDDGKSMETWLLQVKTIEFAGKLAGVLESNKPSA